MATYKVCDTCTVGLANDDWSFLDYRDASEDERNSVFVTVEHIGNVTMGAELDMGYFMCFICNMDSIGGHYWHGEDKN